MEVENGKLSKKHAVASESNGSATKIGDDGNPSRSKRARRTTSEVCIAASPTAASTPVVNVPVPNRCVLLSPAGKLIFPPPPPPTSKPPERTSSIKCVFIGPCESERTAFIQSFVHRGNDNGQKKLASISKKNGNSPSNNTKAAAPSSSSVWSMEYSKKEYSYQNPQHETSTVLLQFYNVSCQIETQQQQKPPPVWKSLCSSFDHVVLVLSLMPEQLTEDYTNQQLTRTIETWKTWMDNQCVPRSSSSGYPMSLLLTIPTRTTVDMNNNGVASTSPSTPPHPSMLIRLGAALEISRQKFGFLKWYLWDLNNHNDGQGGTDSLDEVIQSLVESTKAVVSPSSVAMMSKNPGTAVTTRSRTTLPATPPPSRRSSDSINDVTAAMTTTTAAKTPASRRGDTPGPDTPAPSRANGASP